MHICIYNYVYIYIHTCMRVCLCVLYLTCMYKYAYIIHLFIYDTIQPKLMSYNIYRLSSSKKSSCGWASADVEHSDVPLQV